MPESLGYRLLRIGLLLAVTAAVLQTAAHLTNEFLLDDRIEGLDADIEGNVFTWASSVATFGLAMAALLLAVVFPERRRVFGLLSALAAAFSLDDVVQVHERVALAVGEDLLGLEDHVAVRLWLVFYLPLLVLAGVLLWRIAEQAWAPAGDAIRLGLALLVASIPVELAGVATRSLADEGTSVPEDLRVALEEGLELAGWILAAAGLTTVLIVGLMRYRPASA